ncbi:helix-turn-helix domain-containing protein [Rubinisphaera italica]|uniref:Helix-turn-helix domain protein n=1 Tax=Rubinisphaera italica TaxID=2527969 RepID=A0A5C5XB74_9PLAN|nr:helix-turn-helix domain-containing protein [Rubinisphaera italica]TWT59651.1 Helix-turn-helix domain protein [Rubinisphaera italica]
MLTVSEIAKSLEINPTTVRRLIETGEITAYKVGKTYRVTKEDYEKFLANNKVG